MLLRRAGGVGSSVGGGNGGGSDGGSSASVTVSGVGASASAARVTIAQSLANMADGDALESTDGLFSWGSL